MGVKNVISNDLGNTLFVLKTDAFTKIIQVCSTRYGLSGNMIQLCGLSILHCWQKVRNAVAHLSSKCVWIQYTLLFYVLQGVLLRNKYYYSN